ncbi:MAG TPA: M20/M25/M40 family metallo-hydrolase [Anaerovoracaceae bacterium]|nr:M20/M25/M40 family metallo-hydrolase [Anaerovoracaceae bacterium]
MTEMTYALRLQKMIQCETVSVKGKYDDLEFSKLRSVMEELFPLIHKNAQRKTFSDDCWLYEIKGKNQAKNIVLMSHHDVAPVEGEWKHPGFSGKIEDKRIWGRGTVDTKTSLFAEFSAVEELLEEEGTLPFTVYIASSHDEEIAGDGMQKIVEYFRANSIVPNFILDEGGAVIEPPMAGITKKCSALAVHEKGRFTLELIAEADKEHAGLSANAETPVARMAAFIVRMQTKPPYIRRFTPELSAMFKALAPHMKFPMGFIFSHLGLFEGVLKKIIPKLNAQAGAMLGTTGTFQEISTDKDNGHVCNAKLFLRPLDEEDLHREIAIITEIAAEYGVNVKTAEQGNELHKPSRMEGEAWEHVTNCIAKTFPDSIVMPFILPAGTDARHFSELCPFVYRFAPLDIDNQQFKSVHGVDENIYISAIPKAVQFYKTIISEM